METIPAPVQLTRLADLADQARDYVAAAKAPNTLGAYRADWRDFAGWCGRHGLTALPAEPQDVALYLAGLAGQRKTSTLERRMSAIAQAHAAASHPSPTGDAAVRAVRAGIRRTHDAAPAAKTPALTADVRAMADTLPDTLLGHRDRAPAELVQVGALWVRRAPGGRTPPTGLGCSPSSARSGRSVIARAPNARRASA